MRFWVPPLPPEGQGLDVRESISLEKVCLERRFSVLVGATKGGVPTPKEDEPISFWGNIWKMGGWGVGVGCWIADLFQNFQVSIGNLTSKRVGTFGWRLPVSVSY